MGDLRKLIEEEVEKFKELDEDTEDSDEETTFFKEEKKFGNSDNLKWVEATFKGFVFNSDTNNLLGVAESHTLDKYRKPTSEEKKIFEIYKYAQEMFSLDASAYAYRLNNPPVEGYVINRTTRELIGIDCNGSLRFPTKEERDNYDEHSF